MRYQESKQKMRIISDASGIEIAEANLHWYFLTQMLQ